MYIDIPFISQGNRKIINTFLLFTKCERSGKKVLEENFTMKM